MHVKRRNAGCFCDGDRFPLLLGLRRSSGGDFQWLDGTPFGPGWYSNWGPGQPNNYEGSENCVEMSVDSGKWADVPCSWQRIWMCEKPASAGSG